MGFGFWHMVTNGDTDKAMKYAAAEWLLHDESQNNERNQQQSGYYDAQAPKTYSKPSESQIRRWRAKGAICKAFLCAGLIAVIICLVYYFWDDILNFSAQVFTEKTSKTYLCIENSCEDETVKYVYVLYDGRKDWTDVWSSQEKFPMSQIPIMARDFSLEIVTENNKREKIRTDYTKCVSTQNVIYPPEKKFSPSKNQTIRFVYDGKTVKAEDASFVSDSASSTDANFLVCFPELTDIIRMELKDSDGNVVYKDAGGKNIDLIDSNNFNMFNSYENEDCKLVLLKKTRTYNLPKGDYILAYDVEYKKENKYGMYDIIKDAKTLKFSHGDNTKFTVGSRNVRISHDANFNKITNDYIFNKN